MIGARHGEAASGLSAEARTRRAGTMDGESGKEGGKTRRPRAGRAARTQDGAGTSKVKSTIHLTREASQRLSVHCAMTGFDRSALVEKLINDHLRRYVVSDRGAPGLGVVPVDDAEARRSAAVQPAIGRGRGSRSGQAIAATAARAFAPS